MIVSEFHAHNLPGPSQYLHRHDVDSVNDWHWHEKTFEQLERLILKVERERR